jgi:hypothetical protein
MSASLRMNMFAVRWSESAQWRRVRLRHVPQLAAGADAAVVGAWVASLDAAALLWHVSHDSRCASAATTSASGADPLLVSAACAQQHQCALWLFARDDAAIGDVGSAANGEESGVVSALLTRTATMAAAMVDEGVAALHRALQRAMVAVLLRSERYQLQMQCVVEVSSATARLDAPLSLVDLPRRATRLGYRFSLVGAGALSYLVVSLHDVASLESGALLPHADLPPDVYAEHELRVMAALVSEQTAFPAVFRWQLAADVSSAATKAKGAAVLAQPLASAAAVVDVLSPHCERRALRPVDTGAQASAEFCTSLARYVDPLLSVREAAIAALASKRARDTAVVGDSSRKPVVAAEPGGDKKRARAASLDGAAAAAGAAHSPSQPVHQSQSMFASPRSAAAPTSAMYIPDSTPGAFTGSFSIIARRQDNNDDADDDSSSSSSSDSSSSTTTSSASSSASNNGELDAANADGATAMLTDAVSADVAGALEHAFVDAAAHTEPLAHPFTAPPLEAGDAALHDVPDDKALRPPKLHRNPEPQPLPLHPPPPPPPPQQPATAQPPLSSTPRGLGGSPEQPTPPSLFAPSPTTRVSPLPHLQPVESDSGAVWRQSEQIAVSSLVPRRFGAGYEHAATMAVVRVLRAVGAERVRLESCLELGNAVVERLLVAPAPPAVSCVATASSPSLLAAVRRLARLYEPLATGLHTIDVCSLGESLSAVWRGDERSGASAVEALRTPELRVGFRGQLIDVTPDALTLWERFQLEPFSLRKDVYFYVVGPDSAHLRDQVGAFVRELTVCYQSCNLGVHEPATPVGEESFVPVNVAECTSRASYVRAVRVACDELAKTLAKRGANRVNSCTAVYVVDPFADDAGELHSEPASPIDGFVLADGADESTMRALADAMTPLLLEDERQPAHNLLTVVLPLSDVLHAPLLLATVRDIAFGVYQAGRRIQLSVHAPAPPPVRGDDLRRSAHHLFRQPTSNDPPIVHTPIDWRRRRLWEPLFVLAPPALLDAALDATVLHCCYSLERSHLFASVSDATGELLETIVLPRAIDALPHDADANEHFVRASLASLWNALLGLVAVAGIRAPSLMLYSFGDMPALHARLWEQLARADADSPYGAVLIAALSTERHAMVYAQRGADAVTAPPAAVFFPQAEPVALPALAFVAHVHSEADEGAKRDAGWPHVHRVTLLHRWYRSGSAIESLRASLSKLCHQLARLSWLSTTTRCGGRQTALPWHVAVLHRLTLMMVASSS